MILVGQFDSPFVRRVALALRLYGLPFEHRPWSVFGDAQKVMGLNPLGRVPILILDDGEVVVDSAAILDHLDELAGDGALVPPGGPARREALRVAAVATGLSERVVSLFYERHLTEHPGPILTRRLEERIASALAWLEAEVNARRGAWWRSGGPGHADIAVACAIRHLSESLPDLWDAAAHPALAALSARAEALPAFARTAQPFVGPGG